MSAEESDFIIKDCVQKIECLNKMKHRGLITEHLLNLKAMPFIEKMFDTIIGLWKS